MVFPANRLRNVAAVSLIWHLWGLKRLQCNHKTGQKYFVRDNL